MDYPGSYTRRSGLGCLVIGLAVLLCSGTTIFALDRMCISTVTERLPLYPEAEIKVSRHNMMSAFGMGETYYLLYTPDASRTVTDWYNAQLKGKLRQAIRENDRIYMLAKTEYRVYRAEDGTGTNIQLYSACVQ